MVTNTQYWQVIGAVEAPSVKPARGQPTIVNKVSVGDLVITIRFAYNGIYVSAWQLVSHHSVFSQRFCWGEFR